MPGLLFGLLALSLRPLVFLALVAVGQFVALAPWDRMFARAEKRADRVIGPPVPEPLVPADLDPHLPNVVPLAEWRRRRATS